ncbi:biopolymer transporter ExbD [Mucilaginibacter corticis]|uniref:Biopolymer transporter ExbD n=1 Tax=Mucilaginibacter corticis TaxID=2597670 RepID=A0A556MWG6_9SPHI|nr:biopolymer transporter ExbD [Mucilaginibacter corticis]TSJ44270.1 biopolymer transporter ExbD [Mucilaginibacter corticis]
MAELDTSGGGKHKGGKVRSKKASTRVDLTAMVDLAFLLITFFILTTTLQKPKAMDLTMPDKDDNHNQLPVPETRTMTVLLGKDNKLEWYMGLPQKPLTPPSVTNFGKAGIRESLIEQGKNVLAKSGKEMIVLIKPSDKSTYSDMVSMMDELNIVGNQQRAIVDISPMEVDLLKRDNIY